MINIVLQILFLFAVRILHVYYWCSLLVCVGLVLKCKQYSDLYTHTRTVYSVGAYVRVLVLSQLERLDAADKSHVDAAVLDRAATESLLKAGNALDTPRCMCACGTVQASCYYAQCTSHDPSPQSLQDS